MSRVFKRSLGILFSLLLCFQPLAINVNAVSNDTLQDGIVNVGCATLTDAVQIANSADLLIVEGAYKKLYKVNFLDGTTKSVNLSAAPSCVDYYDNKVYIGCGSESKILIYDLSTLAYVDSITTVGKFYDMAVGNDGYIYTIDIEASPWWETYARSYSPTEKNMVSSFRIQYYGILERNPQYNSFYFTRRGVSPADVHVITYDNGQIKTTYDSRYHGDYVEGYVNRITPDGKFLLNSEGNAVRISSVKADDIWFSFALGTSFTDLCFDASGDQFFSVSGKTITQFKTSTFEKLNSFDAAKTAERIFYYGGRLAALEKDTNGLYYIEKLNPSAVPLPDTAVSSKTLTKTGNVLNLEADSIVDSKFIEATGEVLLLSPTYLYKINTETNVQTKIRFPYTATKLAVYNDTIFVGAGRQGVICLYDLNTLNYKKTIFTDELFLGMEVGNDGYLYTGEDGSWEAARCSFNIETGTRVERVGDTYETANYVKDPAQNAFYFINDLGYFARRTYANGKITGTKAFLNSPGGKILEVTQDGKYIFMSSGNILKYDSTSDTVSFYSKLATAAIDVCVSSSKKSIYAALSGKQIYAYDDTTFDGTATYETLGYPQYIFEKDGKITVVSRTASSSGSYFIEIIDLSAPKTTIQTTITTKSLTYENGRAVLSAKSNVKTIFNGDMMYIVDSTDNSVYAVDSKNLTETKITFPNTPDSIYYYNGELYVGFGNIGKVVILDSSTYSVKSSLVLGIQFYDLAVGNDGYIYVIQHFGSSAYSYAFSFSRTTGQQKSSVGVYPRNGKFVAHPTSNAFYWADTGVSPQDISTLKYADGVITSQYDSPYHGDYLIGSRIKISPDGKNIFTSAGNVFISTDLKSEDMRYKCKFISFVDLAFDLSENKIFASGSTANLYVYDYNSYQKLGFIKTALPVKDMSLNGNNIIALSSQNNVFYLELLDATNVLQAQPTEITVNVPDVYFMTKTQYNNLTANVLFNDGTTKTVTSTAEYLSSNVDVATISATGRLQAVSRGYTQITITAEGISKTIDVYVDVDVDSITVDGYNIAFTPSKTSYSVMLPAGTISAPNINVGVNEAFEVKVTYPASIPGTATVTVGAAGTVRKTYGIYFDKQKEQAAPVTANIESGAVEEGTQIILSSATANANIYYSFNGSSYTKYTGPITINRDTTIYAYASRSDMNHSEITIFTYTIKPKLTTNVIVADATGQRGKDVEVSVHIENNPGIAAFVFSIDFDNTLISPVSVEAGDILADGLFIANTDETQTPEVLKMITVNYSNHSNITSDGVLFTMKFHIKDDVLGNEIPISIYYNEGDIINDTYQSVPITVQNGIVKLKPRLGNGDIYADGVVNVKDGLKMTQYLAGQNVVFTEEEWAAADVNCDGVVDIKDGLRMAQYLAGWNVKLGE